jgi:hypothetical protein
MKKKIAISVLYMISVRTHLIELDKWKSGGINTLFLSDVWVSAYCTIGVPVSAPIIGVVLRWFHLTRVLQWHSTLWRL